MRRRGLLLSAGLVLVVAAAVTVFGVAREQNARSVRQMAAPHLGCAVGEVVVTSQTVGDAAESYEVAGCGKRGTMTCLAPDFECVFDPD